MTSHPLHSDLIKRAKSADRQAFDELTGPLRVPLIAFARKRIGQTLRAKLEPEDVVQDALLKALETISHFQGGSTNRLLSWLMGICDHLISNASRKRFISESTFSDSNDHAGREITPSHGLRRKERLARLEQSLASLKADQREVIILAKIEGLKSTEIAERLGRSESAVRKMISRALKELKAEFGDTESLHLPDCGLNEGGRDVVE